jgi:hypothetical protein
LEDIKEILLEVAWELTVVCKWYFELATTLRELVVNILNSHTYFDKGLDRENLTGY